MSLLKRSAVVAATVAGLTLALAAPAAAHVTVNPASATQGGYTKVTFRVPNETDNADTTKVEVNLPADAPVASVSLKPVTGWTAVATKTKLPTPIEAHGTQITETVTRITWTAQAGAAVKPGQFQEFDVSLGPLPAKDQMVFKALQTYSDGTIVRWIDEPTTDGTEPENPAPVLKLAAAAPEGVSGAPAPVAAASSDADSGSSNGLGIAALIAGILALLVAGAAFVRANRPAAASAATGTPATGTPATATSSTATPPTATAKTRQ